MHVDFSVKLTKYRVYNRISYVFNENSAIFAENLHREKVHHSVKPVNNEMMKESISRDENENAVCVIQFFHLLKPFACKPQNVQCTGIVSITF